MLLLRAIWRLMGSMRLPPPFELELKVIRKGGVLPRRKVFKWGKKLNASPALF